MITNTILRGSLLQLEYNGPHKPLLIIKDPIVIFRLLALRASA